MVRITVEEQCLQKLDQELADYQVEFEKAGKDILGEDGDMYAAVKEAHAVYAELVQKGLSENQAQNLLIAKNLLERTARQYVQYPYSGLFGEKTYAWRMLGTS